MVVTTVSVVADGLDNGLVALRDYVLDSEKVDVLEMKMVSKGSYLVV
jgi:hypothetical protein